MRAPTKLMFLIPPRKIFKVRRRPLNSLIGSRLNLEIYIFFQPCYRSNYVAIRERAPHGASRTTSRASAIALCFSTETLAFTDLITDLVIDFAGFCLTIMTQSCFICYGCCAVRFSATGCFGAFCIGSLFDEFHFAKAMRAFAG